MQIRNKPDNFFVLPDVYYENPNENYDNADENYDIPTEIIRCRNKNY